MARAFLKVLNDFDDLTKNMTKEEREQLLLGMLIYASSGVERELAGGASVAWPFMKRLVDRQMRAYDAKVANGSMGGRGHKRQ